MLYPFFHQTMVIRMHDPIPNTARFGMAKQLIERARKQVVWIGDDHGDPYEQALLTRIVSDEMQISFKEIVEHLRSALDYCAVQIHETYNGKTARRRSYFPIAPTGIGAAAWPSFFERALPSVRENNPDMLNVFAAFQLFASTDNAWLAELAILSNKTKHDNFELKVVAAGSMTVVGEKDGFYIVRHLKRNHMPLSSMHLVVLDSFEWSLNAQTAFYYIEIEPTSEELLHFLNTAVSGVSRIVEELAEMTRR